MAGLFRERRNDLAWRSLQCENEAMAMWLGRRNRTITETPEQSRQGTGPLDNFVVLTVSIIVLAIIGLLLIWYFGFYPGGHPGVEHG
jgi:hypothetical protein